MVVHFSAQIMAFYRHKPNNQDPGEVGGANAPPNSPRLPRKRSPSRVFAARVWPGGHTLLVGQPGFSLWLYLELVSSFGSQILTKWPRILGFNRSILRGFFSTGFQPLDVALILWVRINSDLIQNSGGLLGSFLFISLRIRPANKLNK